MLALALCTFAVGVGTGLIVSALLPDRRTLDERFDAACEQALLLREQIAKRDGIPLRALWITQSIDGFTPKRKPRDRRGRFASRGRK